MPKMNSSYCSLVHVQNKGECQQNPFPLNLARADTRFLGKHPPSEDIDIASFSSSPPHKRNGIEWKVRRNWGTNFYPLVYFSVAIVDRHQWIDLALIYTILKVALNTIKLLDLQKESTFSFEIPTVEVNSHIYPSALCLPHFQNYSISGGWGSLDQTYVMLLIFL